MVHAVHCGSDEEPAQKTIGFLRNAEIRVSEEILDDNRQPGTHDCAWWRSQERNRYQQQTLRNECLNRMKAKSCRQIEICFCMVDLVDSP